MTSNFSFLLQFVLLSKTNWRASITFSSYLMLHHRVARRQISLEYKSCEIIHKQLARRILADDIVYILYTCIQIRFESWKRFIIVNSSSLRNFQLYVISNKGISSNQKLQNCWADKLIFRVNWNCYAPSIFRGFIFLASSDYDKYML